MWDIDTPPPFILECPHFQQKVGIGVLNVQSGEKDSRSKAAFFIAENQQIKGVTKTVNPSKTSKGDPNRNVL